MLFSPPKPRTVTSLPSPLERLMDTPVMRCNDSARLVSGNLPMSSAEIASTTPTEFCLMDAASVRLDFRPVTSITSTRSSSGVCCAIAGNITLVPSSSDMLCVSIVFLYGNLDFMCAPLIFLNHLFTTSLRCSWLFGPFSGVIAGRKRKQTVNEW